MTIASNMTNISGNFKETEGHPSVNIDIDRFQTMVDDPTLLEEQKRDFLISLWTLLVTFVDLKFELKHFSTQ